MAGRRLGQHFLANRTILQRIASAACPFANQTVIEIGPGKGALTEYLVKLVPRVHAVELDQVLVHYLQEKFRNEPKFSVQHGDILKTNLSEWGPVQVAGNLPYYITSPIIERVLALGPNLLHAVFLVQKEVAMRIAAQPGSRDYGYLSVYRTSIRLSPAAAGRFGCRRAQTAARPDHRRSCRIGPVCRTLLPAKA